jgi:hypothetical protein
VDVEAHTGAKSKKGTEGKAGRKEDLRRQESRKSRSVSVARLNTLQKPQAAKRCDRMRVVGESGDPDEQVLAAPATGAKGSDWPSLVQYYFTGHGLFTLSQTMQWPANLDEENLRLESRMRENRPYGSEGGERQLSPTPIEGFKTGSRSTSG